MRPKTEAELAEESDTVRAIYAIFQAFYNPFKLDRYGDPEIPDDTYKGAKYVIIPTTLRCGPSSLMFDDPCWMVDFRPEIKFKKADVVYLSPEYERALLLFIERDQPHDVMRSKVIFLSQRFYIMGGHWGGEHLDTQPRITGVKFSDSLTRASVRYRLRYEFGRVTARLRGKKWVFDKFELIGIE